MSQLRKDYTLTQEDQDAYETNSVEHED
jgi:hypothetical protein